MNKKIIGIIFIGIFLVSLISGLTFKQNSEFNISITCINAGYCTSSAFCNASVIAPDGSVILSGVQATQSSDLAVYNITLNETQSTQLGEYSVGGFCKDGSVTQLIDFTFDITPSGAKPISEGEGMMLFGIILILIITTIFFMISTIYIRNIQFKIFLGSLSLLMLIGTIGFGVTIMQQVLATNTSILGGFTLFYRLFVILLGGAAVGLILWLIVFATKLFHQSRGTKGILD